jgi:hypothetical protein
MKFLILFAVAVVALPSLASAQIESGSLKLLGRGVENSRTHETLTMACVDSDCTSIRLVYFSADGKEARFIGDDYVVTDGSAIPTDDQLKRKLKDFQRSFRRYRREDSFHYHYGRMQGQMGLVTLGTIGVLFAATTNVVFLPVAGGLWFGGGLAILLRPALFKMSPVVATFSDRDGWNWSSSPQKISSKKFKQIVNFAFGRRL